MTSLRRLSQCTLSMAAILSASAPAWGAVIELGPTDDVEAAINAAQPGDEIVLQGGTYTLTQRFGISVSGTAQAPITLRAKDGEKPVLNMNRLSVSEPPTPPPRCTTSFPRAFAHTATS